MAWWLHALFRKWRQWKLTNKQSCCFLLFDIWDFTYCTYDVHCIFLVFSQILISILEYFHFKPLTKVNSITFSVYYFPNDNIIFLLPGIKCYYEVCFFQNVQNVRLSCNSIYSFCYLLCCNRKLYTNTDHEILCYVATSLYGTIHMFPFISPFFDLLYHLSEIIPSHFQKASIELQNVTEKWDNLEDFFNFLFIGFL